MDSVDLGLRLHLQRQDFALQIDEQIQTSGVTAIFGRSGSGKSTLLRCIAGFTPCEGVIRFGSQTWLDSDQGLNVPPHRRGVGFMFQDARLFPHLSVAGNLEFAQRRAPDTQRSVEWSSVIARFALEPLLKRWPATLSGGETQRVTLARTLLSAPRLLLLDEPLAALDEEHKEELLPFLDTLVRDFDVPIVYVSHDVDEVARLADQLLLLEAGRVQDSGRVHAVFERMNLTSRSERFDASVLLDAVVQGIDSQWGLTRLQIAGQPISVPARAGLQAGESLRVRIRARDVALALDAPQGLSIRNALPVRISEIVQDSSSPYAEIWLQLAATAAPHDPAVRLRAQITRAAVADLDLRPGQSVFALIKSVTISLPGHG